jgi:hypothetical protein
MATEVVTGGEDAMETGFALSEIDTTTPHPVRMHDALLGTWEQVLDALRAGCDEAEGADWAVGADSTVIRAHQHAAGARRAPAADSGTGGAGE